MSSRVNLDSKVCELEREIEGMREQVERQGEEGRSKLEQTEVGGYKHTYIHTSRTRILIDCTSVSKKVNASLIPRLIFPGLSSSQAYLPRLISQAYLPRLISQAYLPRLISPGLSPQAYLPRLIKFPGLSPQAYLPRLTFPRLLSHFSYCKR